MESKGDIDADRTDHVRRVGAVGKENVFCFENSLAAVEELVSIIHVVVASNICCVETEVKITDVFGL